MSGDDTHRAEENGCVAEGGAVAADLILGTLKAGKYHVDR